MAEGEGIVMLHPDGYKRLKESNRSRSGKTPRDQVRIYGKTIHLLKYLQAYLGVDKRRVVERALALLEADLIDRGMPPREDDSQEGIVL